MRETTLLNINAGQSLEVIGDGNRGPLLNVAYVNHRDGRRGVQSLLWLAGCGGDNRVEFGHDLRDGHIEGRGSPCRHRNVLGALEAKTQAAHH